THPGAPRARQGTPARVRGQDPRPRLAGGVPDQDPRKRADPRARRRRREDIARTGVGEDIAQTGVGERGLDVDRAVASRRGARRPAPPGRHGAATPFTWKSPTIVADS